MRSFSANSVDFILTDPPYLVRYRDRGDRSIQNDSNGDWLKPAAKILKRRYLGIELNANYHAAATRRLQLAIRASDGLHPRHLTPASRPGPPIGSAPMIA
jgi:DNA modification methylase